jgi:hypothetical protein
MRTLMKMRRPLLTGIILLLFYCSFAQGPSFSTIKQIYNLSVGDSFVYRASFNRNYSGGSCSFAGYTLSTIISYRLSGDSIIVGSYHFTKDTTPCCDAACGTNSGLTSFYLTNIYTQIDSLFSQQYTCDTTQSIQCFDSVFITNSYNFRKQNRYREVDLGFTDETYADGLGLVHQDNLEEDLGAETTLQLIYYHKASGEIWGHPQNLISSISRLSQPLLTANVFPNPAAESFNLKLSEIPSEKVKFELIDETGKILLIREIHDQQTEINRESLSAGVYIWELLSDNVILSRGKLFLN